MPDWKYLSPEECQKLRTERQKNKLNQKYLAGLIGVSTSQFCRIENGIGKCSPEQRSKLEQELDLEVGSLSPACPSRIRSGFVFGSPLLLNQPNNIIGQEVDDLLATLPPEMQADAARLVLEVVSGICRVIAPTRQSHGRKV